MAELVKLKVEGAGGTVHKSRCIIHQEVLCANAATSEGIMQTAKRTNVIRSRALNHRCFKTMLQEMHSEFGDVIHRHVTLKSRYCAMVHCSVVHIVLNLTKRYENYCGINI
jgi:hypothetical protein